MSEGGAKKPRIEMVDPQTARLWIEQGEAVLVDVREPHEFAMERIHGATLVPLSAFDLFKIGIGPSSSHTVGPMRAAHRFTLELEARGLLEATARVETALYGSLALTGKGHDTDKAVILGLSGELPERVDPDAAPRIVAQAREDGALPLLGRHRVAFDEARDLQFRQRETLTRHPNGMRFRAFDATGAMLAEGVYFSVGGGFVVTTGLGRVFVGFGVDLGVGVGVGVVAVGVGVGVATRVGGVVVASAALSFGPGLCRSCSTPPTSRATTS